jgi:methylated-DNA-[protein]-cysteine S-methyltransferase
MIRYARKDFPLGPVVAIADDKGIVSLDFVKAKYARRIGVDWIEDPQDPVIAECFRQLGEYFEGKRREFNLPLAAVGTPFQERVWHEISQVPYGKTISYGELARRAGAPGQARAAGSATGRNPIAVVVPCHRIIGADGSLTGYAGGLPRKQGLLELEGVLQASLI